MTCKDCYYSEICSALGGVFNKKDETNATKCKFFKDQSRIIELPCKVGDKLYQLYTMEGTAMDPFVSDFTETVERIGFATKNVMGGWNVYTTEDFNKTVFLDKEKALEAKEKYKKEVRKSE